MAQLGINPSTIYSAIQAQNAVVPAGMVETSADNVYLFVLDGVGLCRLI